MAVNCGALPGELLESELFGHVRGAFTGAVRDRIGRFELAAGGTLFLDEAGDLPLHLQVKLLRVLQERTFERVGDSHTRQTDARIIAATHLDLRRAITAGNFRDDLYYRLRVVPIEVPPLRRRREDIEPIAEHLLEKINARLGRSLRTAPEVTPALLRYDWPGNVRELENALEFAVAVCGGQTIHPRHLPPEVTGQASDPVAPAPQAHRRGGDAGRARQRERPPGPGPRRSPLASRRDRPRPGHQPHHLVAQNARVRLDRLKRHVSITFGVDSRWSARRAARAARACTNKRRSRQYPQGRGRRPLLREFRVPAG